MPERPARILAVVLSVSLFSGLSLGLHNGMVVCFDDHGHVAVEAAHVEHAHRHAEGEHHGHEDFGADPDHEALHDAIASCFDVHVGQLRPHSLRAHEHQLGRPTAVAVSVIATADLMPTKVSAGDGMRHLRGATARSELACLSGIVLLV